MATTSAHRMRIGFIGLGNMGCPMAARIASAGFPLVVHDVNREVARNLLEAGAAWADSPWDVAQQSDVVCTSLPGPVEAQDVFFSEHGIARGARSGSILLDFTTNSVALVRQMHSHLTELGAAMLDSPVSGGVEAAKKGELTLLVGGDDKTLSAAKPVLDYLANTILHVGAIGTASVCKVLHNCAVFCANWATMECLTAGVKAGVDAATLIEVFQKSGLGRNLDLQVAMPATLFRGNFQPRFAMKAAHKDMALATELARDLGVPMEMAQMCEAAMADAIRRGWGEHDNTVFLTLQEERAGAQVRTGSKSHD
jgi:3-hydroxyisobutyrate dehydrogenase